MPSSADNTGALSSDVLTIRDGAGLDALKSGGSGLLMVRPEYVRFAGAGETYDFTLSGRLHGEYALGSRIQYELETPSGMVTVEKLREDRLSAAEGDEISIGFNADVTHFIGDAT